MKDFLRFFCVLMCTLILVACENMNAAWDNTKSTLSETFTAPASATKTSTSTPAPSITVATNDDPVLEPIRSDTPLADIKIADQAYADEATNHGTPPVSGLIPVNYHAPTPTTLAGGKLINTYQLHQQIIGKKPPLLINALAGENTELISESIWLSGAGAKGKFNDDIQQQLGQRLEELTSNDRKRMLVFYCAALDCWSSYNAALRAVNLGYSNVYWYRGGLAAWYEAGLPTVQTSDDQW